VAFTVRDFHDLSDLLEKEPAWRADIRRLVLSEEILSLPQVMRELARVYRNYRARLMCALTGLI